MAERAGEQPAEQELGWGFAFPSRLVPPVCGEEPELSPAVQPLALERGPEQQVRREFLRAASGGQKKVSGVAAMAGFPAAQTPTGAPVEKVVESRREAARLVLAAPWQFAVAVAADSQQPAEAVAAKLVAPLPLALAAV